MDSAEVARLRLLNQQIAAQRFERPDDLVAWMGAVQAQDALAARWALGLRLAGATEAGIEQAAVERRIVRTWPMRGTLHYVAAADIRWLLRLLAPRVIKGAAGRYRQLELDGATFDRAREICIRVLAGGRLLSRPALYAALETGGVATTGQRGIHILGRLSMEGLLCIGPYVGAQPAFALLDEWLPPARVPEGEEALAELARRYFTSHGPATTQDFAWWTGLPLTQAKAAIELLRGGLVGDQGEAGTFWLVPAAFHVLGATERVVLLPGFDEYLLGYRDRSAVLDAAHTGLVNPGSNGILNPIVVIDGCAVGTWKRTLSRRGVRLTFQPFAHFDATDTDTIHAAARRYAVFLGKPLIDGKN
jgi:hypothetical protein